MGTRPDQATMDQWYPIGSRASVPAGETRDRLLGSEILVEKTADAITVRETASGRVLPILERYQMLWTSLGNPPSDLFALPEANEPDRRIVDCGPVLVRASGLRMIENFLDMAHFPFVHTNILGAEPHTDVPDYRSEIRRDVDEVWATNCTFFQSQIAATESGGDFVHLTFRVPSPFVVMLYRVCPSAPDRLDAIALFIQPISPGLCRAQPVMYLVDNQSSQQELLRFEQVIFAQDLLIVQNQRPLLMPLDTGAEIPTRADSSSVAYRRWLKEKGIVFGTTLGEAA